MTGSTPTIVLEHVSVDYGECRALRDVSLTLTGPGSIGVVGPSGSGKTTLLYTMAGLEDPSTGHVFLLGTQISGRPASEVSSLRLRHVGFVFQQADLVPELTIEQNIALPLELNGLPRRTVRARVRELARRLDLEACAGRRPSAVSGGQAQRAAVGRAVAMRPAVIFADEPTGALDSVNGDAVISLLLREVHDSSSLLVVVTHDHTVAERMDRKVCVQDGNVTTPDVGSRRA